MTFSHLKTEMLLFLFQVNTIYKIDFVTLKSFFLFHVYESNYMRDIIFLIPINYYVQKLTFSHLKTLFYYAAKKAKTMRDEIFLIHLNTKYPKLTISHLNTFFTTWLSKQNVL